MSDLSLGYLMDFKEKGIFSTEGKVDWMTEEETKAHNALLDEAMLTGLDENCEIGQCGTFYVKQPIGYRGNSVITFCGSEVAPCEIYWTPGSKVKVVEFKRKGKTYRGKWYFGTQDCFNFKRIK